MIPNKELKKDILGKRIDGDHLDQISGGTMPPISAQEECAKISKRDNCKATVDLDFWRWSNDACTLLDCKYSVCKSVFVDQSL